MRSRVIYADTYRKRHQRRLFLLAVLIIALGALFVWWHQRNPRPDPQT
ncbi:MAG: 1,4-beta-N-acetylmuramidase, partial [Lacticaseibacillus paracasei]|nr:1,4-beta-N-acetylmuramidase [Lacticaseibacillus paracasei]